MFKRFLALSLVILIFLSGCSVDFGRFIKKEKDPVSNLAPEALLIGKDAIYNETVKFITSAQTSVYIEQSQFADPRLSQLLIQKAESGVEIRVLLDQWQQVNRTTLNELKSKNISVQYYPAQKGQSHRVKFIVTDYEKAIIYSSPWTETGWNSHNLAVKLTGKSAWKTASLFNKDWEFTTTLSLNVPKSTSLPEDNIVLARNANVKQQIIEHISRSRRSVWAEVTEVSEPDTVQALIDAAGKGKDVRLILDPAAAKNTTLTVNKLQTAGVQIRYFKNPEGRPLGMNIGIFDGNTFILSSSNWTHFAFVVNHENSVTVPSPSATTKLIEMFDRDWLTSTIQPET